MISCRRAISDTTAPGAYDSATIRPLSSSLHRRRRPTPLRISTRPRGAVASTIWSTIYANRSCQHRSHLPNYAALRKMGAKHRLRHHHARPFFKCSEFFAYEREAKCQYSASDQPSKHPADGEHKIDLRKNFVG